MGFGEILHLLPPALKIPANLSCSAPEASAFSKLPHQYGFCNRTFSRARFLNKNTFQGPLLIKRSKAKLSWYKGSCTHMYPNKCGQKLARRARITLKIICLIEQEPRGFSNYSYGTFLGNTLLLFASSFQPQLTGSLLLPFLREGAVIERKRRMN